MVRAWRTAPSRIAVAVSRWSGAARSWSSASSMIRRKSGRIACWCRRNCAWTRAARLAGSRYCSRRGGGEPPRLPTAPPLPHRHHGCRRLGRTAADYRLDIYDPQGSRLIRTTGVAAARLAVDTFRNVYTLNYEVVANAPRIEPSLSQWNPSTPEGCPTPPPTPSA